LSLWLPALQGNARSSSIRYWVIHAVTLPAIFLAGFFFVSTGLAYDAFGTPRPDAYFQAAESKAPVVSQRYQGKTQLDQRLQ
jgi:photosystem II cytochrome b559 subunit alpha